MFLALAADEVWAGDNVVLNPHYKDMGNLYGSEYWTYLLPRRAGEDNARAGDSGAAADGRCRGMPARAGGSRAARCVPFDDAADRGAWPRRLRSGSCFRRRASRKSGGGARRTRR